MPYTVIITPDAREDIRYFKPYEQRIISQGIRTYLTNDAFIESKHRKSLGENAIAPWEVRVENYRIFFKPDDEDTNSIVIVSVGHKEHNQLYIRGRKVQL
jgi:mRNA-degrading endonuclease RelE of RelBE toxin-antitoxin system